MSYDLRIAVKVQDTDIYAVICGQNETLNEI